MKATRKLIPAIAMLLISAVMMSTATFAWFSTNSSVEANNMQVSAQAKNTFLVISTTNTVGDTDYDETAIGATVTNATLYPIMYVNDAIATAKKDAGSTDKDGNDLLAGKWYTAVGTATTNGAAKDNKYTVKNTTDGYVLKNTFYVRVADNFGNATNLQLESVDVSGTYANAVAVLAKVEGATDDLDRENYYIEGAVSAPEYLADEVTSGACIAIDVYIYFNGENTDVTTAKALSLEDYTVVIKFKVDGSEA